MARARMINGRSCDSIRRFRTRTTSRQQARRERDINPTADAKLLCPFHSIVAASELRLQQASASQALARLEPERSAPLITGRRRAVGTCLEHLLDELTTLGRRALEEKALQAYMASRRKPTNNFCMLSKSFLLRSISKALFDDM